MTCCFLCRGGVGFGEEVAGLRELGVVNRGGHAEITTYVKDVVESPVSGNIIDLCPVGALTSKPFRFKARAWELAQAPSIAPHDCLGSNINVHTYQGNVLRVVAHEHPAINETWLSDRDRFGYVGLHHEDRLKHPRIRVKGVWHDASWEHALMVAADGLRQMIASEGADQLGALISPNATLEEFYLFQKLVRGLGSLHVDHRLRTQDVRDEACAPLHPLFAAEPAEFAKQSAILIIGSHFVEEAPLLAIRVRQAVRKQCAVSVINPVDYAFDFTVS